MHSHVLPHELTDFQTQQNQIDMWLARMGICNCQIPGSDLNTNVNRRELYESAGGNRFQPTN